MLHSESVTEKREYVTCDKCGTRITRQRKCPGCKIDICEKCGVWWYQDPFDGNDYGDYPPLACLSCDEMAKPYGVGAKRLVEECDAKVEALKADWLRECSATISANRAGEKA